MFNETKVRNFKLVDKTILSKTYGFIKGSEILEKKEDNGIYTVKAKYLVSKNIGDDDFFYILHQMKKPKVGVIITNLTNELNKISRTAIESELSKYGFNLFDSDRIKQISDYNSLANEGLDVIITGQVTSEYAGKYYGLESARSKIFLSSYWASTGKLISSINEESGGSDITKNDAIKTAIKKSSQLAGEKLAKDIIKTWMDYLANGLPIQIIALDVSNDEYNQLLNRIKSIFKVYSHVYSNNTAVFEIESTIFTDDIYSLYFSDYILISQNMMLIVIK
ncbi:hypothetical protein [Marinitoga sp. 38H-ov]|uniref:hypothetical protein n=1 Tax=Marinitoga sp. 38H-ov TaxID=1755814 RepID=UPI0016939113|nr:hypothetical protein [Marinitoga sp. 38H-ov]KAF2956551.1 hypothetical protein AS160_04975 [Marinitoga sp. 38H-ov]